MVSNPTLIRFGHRVRTLRKRQGLSQEDLAEKSGLHRTYIGGIERGERNPALLNLLKLAAALEVEVGELLNGLAYP